MNAKLPRLFTAVAAIIALPFLLGCDDNGGNDRPGQPTLVDEITINDEQLEVGEGTVVFNDISFDIDDVFQFGNHIILVVHLPRGLSYRIDTAELDGGGRNDIGLFPRVRTCIGGDSFLEFDLTPSTLINGGDPDGDSEARVKFTVDAESSEGGVIIESRAASNTLSYSCDSTLLADATIRVVID